MSISGIEVVGFMSDMVEYHMETTEEGKHLWINQNSSQKQETTQKANDQVTTNPVIEAIENDPAYASLESGTC